jgi:DegV family protein with EDD domain
MAVKVVTDSTSDFPPELARDLDITVVPLTVFFGDEAFKDGVEITREQFFDRLTNGNVHPRTTQPSVGDFVEVYKTLTEQGHEIVSVHVSDKLSGTMNSALSALQEMPDAKVEIVNSQLTAIALTLVVKKTAEIARAGGSLQDVAAAARDAAAHIHSYFVLDTLEYLQKGGRIGKAQALIGGLLSIKPILTLVDGEIHPHEKVRTHAKAISRLKEIAAMAGPFEEVGLVYEGPGDGEEQLIEFFQGLTSNPVVTGKIGPVVGTHTGPAVVGFAALSAS